MDNSRTQTRRFTGYNSHVNPAGTSENTQNLWGSNTLKRRRKRRKRRVSGCLPV